MKYQIIYADPPYKYIQGKSMGTNFAGAADRHYTCMPLEDIKCLPVATIAEGKCILFLWVTFPMLREGLEVIKAWGFEYKTVAFTWVKTNVNNMGFLFGVGYYTKSNAEVCLLATRGNAHQLVRDNSISQMIMTPKMLHSHKPPEVRERIVQMLGDLPRIELFARRKVEGWDSWGLEVESDIEL